MIVGSLQQARTMSHFEGKIAIITGAGSGIGRALAQRLNREGCLLEIADIDEEGLEETRLTLQRQDLACTTSIVDVGERSAVEAWAMAIGERHGGRADIVVNNAGVSLTASVEDSSYDDLEWLMGINFWGVVYGCKSFLPLLRQSSSAHLINISSIFGVIAVPGQSAYHAAKFAVRGYTEALRQELADTSIHVCCVHPGGVKTNIVRSGRHPGGRDSIAVMSTRFEQMARTTPESAADQLVTAMLKRKQRLLIGLDARLMSLVSRLFPTAYPKVLARLFGMGED